MILAECCANFWVASEVCTTNYIKEFYGDTQDIVKARCLNNRCLTRTTCKWGLYFDASLLFSCCPCYVVSPFLLLYEQLVPAVMTNIFTSFLTRFYKPFRTYLSYKKKRITRTLKQPNFTAYFPLQMAASFK